MVLRIYNSATHEKMAFEPIEPGKVGMYVCGITSYAASHIGHARSAIAFDVIFRWLKRSYDVTFVRNYTDIDDKIIKAASALGEDLRVLSERYIAQFETDMRRLGCVRPTVEPKVTDHMPEIIGLIQCLQEKGFAYAVEGDVYFEVATFANYGSLSGLPLDELESGARVEVDRRKRSPFDFALWKSAKPGEPSWGSPWGAGRPGWHIECSAMSAKYLGKTFDIHGGGKDLLFPHHENEVAQSCAANDLPILARWWLHNGFVNLPAEVCPKCGASLPAGISTLDLLAQGLEPTGDVPEACPSCRYAFTENDVRMSKSRGNFYPVREVTARYEAEALRYLLLMSQYRNPLQFSHELLDETERRLDRLYETLLAAERFTEEHQASAGESFVGIFGFDPRQRFHDAMDDDFNTAKALGDLSELFKIANDMIHGREGERIGRSLSSSDRSRLLGEVRATVRDVGEVLGLWHEEAATYLERRRHARSASLAITPPEIEKQIQDRMAARQAKNFRLADQIRDDLKAKGIILKDGSGGTTWDVLAS